ncbi:MAG: YdcF family protein [Paracoccaceae bacterium]
MGVIRGLVKWGLRLAVAVLALTAAAVAYFSDANLRLYGGGRGLVAPVDAILVLGGGVDADGVLGYSSRRRVAVAVALLEAGRTRKLIFSGGPEWQHPEYTAAGLMRVHAIALGAPPEALLTEVRSSSTFENLRFGFALAEDRGLGKLAILTDAFHLERARMLADYFGYSDVALAAVRGLEFESTAARVWGTLREAMAWWYNLAKVAAWEVLGAAGLDADARGELIR